MKKISRRDALKSITALSLGTGLLVSSCRPNSQADLPGMPTAPGTDPLEGREKEFFTDHEFETVRQLANLIIPADEKSGNAEDANVPNFIDYAMIFQPANQTTMRGGLKWLDVRCLKLYDSSFIDCTEVQQTEILDEIAYPEIASAEVRQGVRFFNLFRDLTAAGFWSSKMGVEDLQYMGNVPHHWTGCPDEVMEHIGISYDS